jgi:hypothetical protein
MDRTRIADHHGMRRDITVNEGSGGYQDIVSNRNLTYHGSIHADAHHIADGGDTLARSPAFRPDCHAFMKVAIVAKDSIPIHGNVVGVTQIKPLSNPSATRNLNPMFPRMKPEQGFVNGSGNRVFQGLCLPEKEMPYPQIP